MRLKLRPMQPADLPLSSHRTRFYVELEAFVSYVFTKHKTFKSVVNWHSG